LYRRAKGLLDKKAFGTERDVYAEGHRWITHSIAAKPPTENPNEDFRVAVGGPDCTRPYRASLLNISAMSFGALSANAIRALNTGARMGDFAHNTGEGGISRHHREPGGDLIWQVGTGYFGCRGQDGSLDPDAFAQQAALESVRMIELKLSQGAKPGHGGILPGAKVTGEIAEARGVELGEDCTSPPSHSAFSTPLELIDFVARLRSLAQGKPVGIKLSIGEPVELMSICRAIHETGSAPDFITVDGGEGGTGAAPIEFSDHMGMPVLEAIVLVHNALLGIGYRDRIRLFAAGKLITSVDIAMAIALGADGVNTARGFMFGLGCIQTQLCHTNNCPVGVATQDSHLARALDVESKAERVRNLHASTLSALAEVVGAAGLERPAELERKHIFQRVSPWEIQPFSNLYPSVRRGSLLDNTAKGFLPGAWAAASVEHFGAQ
jgi:glutamate synthase domain-containing protein 2